MRAATERAADGAAGIRRWLGSGLIQHPCGAFAAWTDPDGRLAFRYPEITGYALTWLAGRPELTRDERAAGDRAAAWLAARIDAGVLSARDGWDGGAVYAFDLGMVAAGLISYGRAVGDEAAAGTGERTAGLLAAAFADGMPAVLPHGPPTSRPSSWSTTGRPHLLKCVQSLLLADAASVVASLMGRAASLQRDDGAFSTQPGSHDVMLHPHFYAIEGLWIAGRCLGDDDALARARRATTWAWEHQLPSGGFPRVVAADGGSREAPEQLDVTSQAVRAALLLGTTPAGLGQAVDRLVELARPAATGRALGYQPAAAERHANAWVSMFGAQALELAAQDTPQLDWDALV